MAEAIKEKEKRMIGGVWENGVDLKLKLYFSGGQQAVKTPDCVGEEEKIKGQAKSICVKISRAHTNVTSRSATAGIFVLFTVV